MPQKHLESDPLNLSATIRASRDPNATIQRTGIPVKSPSNEPKAGLNPLSLSPSAAAPSPTSWSSSPDEAAATILAPLHLTTVGSGPAPPPPPPRLPLQVTVRRQLHPDPPLAVYGSKGRSAPSQVAGDPRTDPPAVSNSTVTEGC